jgi:hypothetical protein
LAMWNLRQRMLYILIILTFVLYKFKIRIIGKNNHFKWTCVCVYMFILFLESWLLKVFATENTTVRVDTGVFEHGFCILVPVVSMGTLYVELYLN